MTDRCYTGVTLLKKNVDELQSSTWEFDEIDYDDGTVVTGIWREAPYGFIDELRKFAESGASFYGFSGQCGEFMPTRFVGVDNHCTNVETSMDGDVVVRVGSDGTALDDDLVVVRHYFTMLKRVQHLFGLDGEKVDAEGRTRYPY